MRGKTTWCYADILYGSGLRSGFANTSTHLRHVICRSTLGTSTRFTRELRGCKTFRNFRFDVLNVFDQVLRAAQRIGYWRRRAAVWTSGGRSSSGLTFDF